MNLINEMSSVILVLNHCSSEQWILFLTFWRQWEFNQVLSREQILANIAYGMP